MTFVTNVSLHTCPLVLSFWQKFFNSVSKMLSITVKVSPHIDIFECTEDRYNFTKLDINAFTSLLAR